MQHQFINMITSIYRANWVRVNGTKYQMPCAIVIGMDEDEPKFGSVENIYIDGASVFFEFVPMITNQFCHHFHAFALASQAASSDTYLINHCLLLDFHPYGLYHSTTILSEYKVRYVIVRNNVYIT